MKPVLVCAFIMLSLTVGAHAEDLQSGAGKDMCLLDINNCLGQSFYNIVDKIARIRAAIEKGSLVYTPQEVEHLKYMLVEALETAERIDADPSQVPENRDK